MDHHHTNQSEIDRWTHWDPDSGYHKPPNKSVASPEEFYEGELPRRAIAPGIHMGLTVMLDVEKDDYYCSGTESVGFKVKEIKIGSGMYFTVKMVLY